MEAILERCAGLDVHQETVVACVYYGKLNKKPKKEIQTFTTTTKGLLELHDWLKKYECTHVAMESTGVYWKPVWNILEDSFELILANAKHIKNVPGRKTDVKDAAWITQLLRCGLITPSMVPRRDLRDLRDLTRYRRKLTGEATREKNRIHKILQDANIKLTSYMSDVFGVSGRILLESIINGEVLTADQVKDSVKTSLKKKVPQLVDALNGRVRLHHRTIIGLHMDHLNYLEKHIAIIEEKIDEILTSYREEEQLLITLPGVQKDAAAVILAEIGNDMSFFSTDAHLASWAGVCPGNNQSAGKKKSSRSTKGNKGLKAVLCQVAWAATRQRGARITAFFYRVRKRRGEKKAIMATAHLILKIIYHMLTEKVSYLELGDEYLPKQTSKIDYFIKKLEAEGFTVTSTPQDKTA